MRRRDFIAASLSMPLALVASGRLVADAEAQSPTTPFTASTVRNAARELAAKPFKAPPTQLPESLAKLDYDHYRMIRFRQQSALWRPETLPFEVQFFHRGFLFNTRVDIFQVVEGRAEPVAYDPGFFTFGDVAPPKADDLGFAGFRLHAPFIKPDYYDEICTFLGASYFRAVAKNQVYGLSARGLALKTASPDGEEFPVFRSFWIERPLPGTGSIVVHALLDSRSAAAAFRFTIRPGDTTVFDTEMALYPRVELKEAGIAPMTSMFFFDANDRVGVDDYREAVHDSDGLAMSTGRGETLWRPLSNPVDLQVSAFQDVNPRGFGLMQRERDFTNYQDLEAAYERRPSLWVEPIGDWGQGAVYLVEIPTDQEVHDNIVAFWRPKAPLAAHEEYVFNYRLHWGSGRPHAAELARTLQTRVGGGGAGRRLFVIDFAGPLLDDPAADEAVRGKVSAGKGEIANVVVHRNPETKGMRLSFELAPGDAGSSELRAELVNGAGPISEAWVYRWTR